MQVIDRYHFLFPLNDDPLLRGTDTLGVATWALDQSSPTY